MTAELTARILASLSPNVPMLSGVTAIAAGGKHSLAVTKDGAVYAWGENQRGQLGEMARRRAG